MTDRKTDFEKSCMRALGVAKLSSMSQGTYSWFENLINHLITKGTQEDNVDDWAADQIEFEYNSTRGDSALTAEDRNERLGLISILVGFLVS